MQVRVRLPHFGRQLASNNALESELIENGMEAGKSKQQEFFDLAERFRSATDAAEVKRLGEQIGRMVFGDGRPAFVST
jgi:hypothetical protein